MTEIPETFQPIPGYIVPDEFWPAFEFQSDARYAAIYWTPCGDEAIGTDGRLSGDCNWMAYLTLVEHAVNVIPFCQATRHPIWILGSSNAEATHWLVIDRQDHAVWLAPRDAADRFLHDQWPPSPPITLTKDDLDRIHKAFQDAIAQFNKEVKLIDVYQLMQQDQARITALQDALDAQPKLSDQ